VDLIDRLCQAGSVKVRHSPSSFKINKLQIEAFFIRTFYGKKLVNDIKLIKNGIKLIKNGIKLIKNN
jgi:hypothetical protein